MKRLLALLLALGLAAPAAAQETPFTHAENQFAVDLYGKLGAQPGNFVVSPYSIATALGMVYAGAKGGTAAEISRALHVQGMSRAVFLQGAKTPVLQASDGFTFHAANALWVAPHEPLEPVFTGIVRDDFGAGLNSTDFADPEGAADEINGWVAKQTADKIENLVSPDMFSAETRLVLTNAVYFKADWAGPFDPQYDAQLPFHAPGGDVTAMMLNRTDDYSLTQADGAKILSMPYAGDAALVLVLPDANDGLPAVEKNLSAARLAVWLAQGQSQLVAVTLPKFKETSAFGLNETLQALGIRQAYNPLKADLSGIADVPGKPLYISDAVHKAYISVDEQGTEAAAATAVVLAEATAAPDMPMPQPILFVADHPFLYFIRANSTGAVLFMGRVDDPTQD